MISSGQSSLLTDLYLLTMLQGYFDQGMVEQATFEFYVRALPRSRNYLVAAGLHQVVDYLQEFRFRPDEIEYLSSMEQFSDDFLRDLERLRFEGDVWAMPEGTIFFPDEPILRVTAPLPQAQIVETRIINILQFQTLIASKAARIRTEAPDALLVDFGLRRAHGAEAGLFAARAAYLAGFAGTSAVLAGREFGIPVFGTMAHAYVQAHADEAAAFKTFAQSHPHNVVLLIDTYDTEEGARTVVNVSQELSEEGIFVSAVRIDSGDLASASARVRVILDQGGLENVGIFVSGGLDEYRIRDLLRADAPVTGFGVGTRMVVSEDAPSLNCAYKLVEYGGLGRRKRSEGKATWPGKKQVYRRREDRTMAGDTLCLDSEVHDGEPLLVKVMEAGCAVDTRESLETVRARAALQLGSLPPNMTTLEPADRPYSVMISSGVRALAARIR